MAIPKLRLRLPRVPHHSHWVASSICPRVFLSKRMAPAIFCGRAGADWGWFFRWLNTYYYQGRISRLSEMPGAEPRKEPYLKIPVHILNITQLDLCEKVLLAYIYSFGVKGCWQSNATLARMFMVSDRTIKNWLAKIRCLLFIRAGRGYYRMMWAKSHPQVRERNRTSRGNNCPATGQNRVLRVGKNLPTTSNITISN